MSKINFGGRRIRKRLLTISIMLLIAGALLTVYEWGWFDSLMTIGLSTVTPFGNNLGVKLTMRPVVNPLTVYSAVPGSTYEWHAVATNTGTAAWTDMWINTRLGVNGATATQVTCVSNPASCTSSTQVAGSFYVETCTSGGTTYTDNPLCREDITNTAFWNLKISTDGSTWQACQNIFSAGKGCAVDYKILGGTSGHPLASGAHQDVWFKITVPTTASYQSGTFPFMTQLMATADTIRAVQGQTDTLSIGTISGTWTWTWVGYALSIFAVLGIIGAFV